MSHYKGAKANVNVESHLSREFEVNVGVHHDIDLSPLLFSIVIDVVTGEITDVTLQEMLLLQQ